MFVIIIIKDSFREFSFDFSAQHEYYPTKKVYIYIVLPG